MRLRRLTALGNAVAMGATVGDLRGGDRITVRFDGKEVELRRAGSGEIGKWADQDGGMWVECERGDR